MKKFIIIACISLFIMKVFTGSYFYSPKVTHAIYYVSSTTGNDANAGTSPALAWQTLNKVNATTFSPGDSILFKRGDVFAGRLNINQSGTAPSRISYAAFGTGSQPIITGFSTISSWTNLGSNIWESSFAVSSLPYTNLIASNGVNTAMGRTPNTNSYYTYQTRTGYTQITSSDLTGAPNWTGAELVMNVVSYRLDRNPITAQTGSTLTFTPDITDTGFHKGNLHFIIQNDVRTLDTIGEWYYNPVTKKLRMFSIVSPTNVQIPTVDTLVYLPNRNFITFDNITFTGANTVLMQITHTPNLLIQNCNFDFSGRDGIFGSAAGASDNCQIFNCTINHINNNGIDLARVDFTNPQIVSCTAKNCGMIYGEIDKNDGVNNANTALAMQARGTGALFEFNRIDSMGFMGIGFFGSNTLVQYNYITNFTFLLNDGGGIYTVNGGVKSVQSNVRVLFNIIGNNKHVSNINGADYGIYLDDLSNNVEIRGNTVFNCSWGFELHSVFNVKLRDNTAYDNAMASIILISDNGSGTVPGHAKMDSIEMKNNIFFDRDVLQHTLWIYALINPLVPPHLNSDSNYFARPIDNNGASILTNFNDQAGQVINRPLPNWQALSGGDAHSLTTPKPITSVDSLLFEFNPTTFGVNVPLPAIYIDVRNVTYNPSINLPNFGSAVLIKNGDFSTSGRTLKSVWIIKGKKHW